MLEAAVQSYKDIDAWKKSILKKESFDLLQTVMKEAGEYQKEKSPKTKIKKK